MSKKTRPLLAITWLDHTSNDDWTAPDTLDDRSGSATINSVGWLMKSTKKAYIIASTVCADDDHTGQTMTIIKGAILRKHILPSDFALKILSEDKASGKTRIPRGRNEEPATKELSSIRQSSTKTT